MGKPHNVKIEPATPLPWISSRTEMLGSVVKQQAPDPNLHTGPVVVSTVQRPGKPDAAYIAHAANAYPKLVEALETIAALKVDGMLATGRPLADAVERATTLLRSLGESN